MKWLLAFKFQLVYRKNIWRNGRQVDGLIARPIDSQDVPHGTLHIGHLRGRVLPVAAAKFMDLMITALRERFPKDLDQ